MGNVKKKTKKSIKKIKQNHTKIYPVRFIFISFFIVSGIMFFSHFWIESTYSKEDWGQVYYNYLLDKKEEVVLPEESEEHTIKFYSVKEVENPVMVLHYQINGKQYANVYFIADKKVNPIIYEEPVDIEFLYNVEKNESDYYLHIYHEEEEYFESISHEIKERIEDSVLDIENPGYEYIFSEEDRTTVKDMFGNVVSFSESEEVFIKPDLEEKEGLQFSLDMDPQKLKETIKNSIQNYELENKSIQNNLEEKIAKKSEEVQNRKKEVAQIKSTNSKEKSSVESTYKKLRGVWKEQNGDFYIEFTTKKKKKWFNSGWFSSGKYISGYITDFKKIGKSIYQFTVSSEKWNIDVSKIKKKKIKIGNITYTYIKKS